MSALAIGLLEADVVPPADPGRVARLQRQLVETALHERGAGQHGRAGEWCVRRLEVRFELEADELDVGAANRWADVIGGAVRDLVADGQTVLQYPHRARALAELAEAVVDGSVERAWAWRQLRLLQPEDPDPGLDPAGALVAALAREPQRAVAVLSSLVRRAGPGRLDDLLGERGWTALADAVTDRSVIERATGRLKALASEPSDSPHPPGLLDSSPASGAVDQLAPEEVVTASISRVPESAARRVIDDARAAAVLAGSVVLATRGRTSGATPSPALVAAWAALAVAEVEPSRPVLIEPVAVLLWRRLAGSASATSPWSSAGSWT